LGTRVVVGYLSTRLSQSQKLYPLSSLEGTTNPQLHPYESASFKKRSAFATSADHDTGADLLDGPLAGEFRDANEELGLNLGDASASGPPTGPNTQPNTGGQNSPTNYTGGQNSPMNQNMNQNQGPRDMSKFGRESMAGGGQGNNSNFNPGFQPPASGDGTGNFRSGNPNNVGNNVSRSEVSGQATWSPGAAKAALAAAGGVGPARTNSRGSDDSYVILPQEQRQRIDGNNNIPNQASNNIQNRQGDIGNNPNVATTSPEFFSAQPTPAAQHVQPGQPGMGKQMQGNNQFQQGNNPGNNQGNQDFSGLFEESVHSRSDRGQSSQTSNQKSGAAIFNRAQGVGQQQPQQQQQQQPLQQNQQQNTQQQNPQQPRKSLTEQLENQQSQRNQLLHQRPVNPVQQQPPTMEDLGFAKRGKQPSSPKFDASPKFDPWLDNMTNPDNDEIYMLKFLEEMTKRKEGKERLAKLRAVEKEHDEEVREMEAKAARLQAEQKELAQGNVREMDVYFGKYKKELAQGNVRKSGK
jgi:hypothetical protein